MTATTTARFSEMVVGGPSRGSIPIAADTLILKNTLVAINASGQAVPPTDGDGFPILGRSNATYDNRTGSEAGGAAGAIQVFLTYGVEGVECADTVQPGDPVYSLDNQTVSASSNTGARGLAGFVTEQRDGLTYVFVGPLAVYLQSLEARIATLEAAP